MSETVDFERYLRESAEALASRLDLPTGFLRKLEVDDDDWSFVVKLHALFEGALLYHLESMFCEERFFRIFCDASRPLPFWHKLKLARQIGVLGPRSLSFLGMLSELRNELVHDIGKVSFSFEAFIETIAGIKKRFDTRLTKQRVVDALSGFWPFVNIGKRDSPLPKDHFVFGPTRDLMFYHALNVLTIIYHNRTEDELVRDAEERKKRFREKMIAEREKLSDKSA